MSKVEQARFEPAPIWDVGFINGSLTMSAPEKNFYKQVATSQMSEEEV